MAASKHRLPTVTIKRWIAAGEENGGQVITTEPVKSTFVEPDVETGFSSGALSDELSAMVALGRATRTRLQDEMRLATKVERDHVVAYEMLTRSVARLLGEIRQIERQQSKEDMSEAEIYQTLIDNGWSPPEGWVAPTGMKNGH